MSLTSLTTYMDTVNASIKVMEGLNPLLARLRGNYAFPGLAQSGVVSMPIVSAFTASTTVTDGTLVTNGLNNTIASLTLSENHVEWSLPPIQAKNIFTSPANQVTIARQMVDALAYKALDVYVTALISGTPTTSNALATAKTNFAAATTAELAKLTASIVGPAGNRGGSLMDFSIIIHPTAYANLVTYGANLINTPLLLGSPSVSTSYAQATYHGVPIYPFGTSSTSFWGAASNTCAFIVHPDGAPLIMDDPQVHGNGIHDADDVTTKLILKRPFAYSGAAQVALLGEVTNPAS